MSKTTILLIRHGETEWNASGRWQGQSDIPLNEKGMSQAKLLANRLRSWPIDTIISSDLRRATQTASVLGDALNLQPMIDKSWRERNGGSFEGLTARELEAKADFHGPRDDKNWAPLKGETNLQVAERVQLSFDKVVKNHPDEMVAIVTHGGTIITLLSLILGFPAGERARLWVSRTTGFSIVEVGERGAFLARLNDEAHVDSE